MHQTSISAGDAAIRSYIDSHASASAGFGRAGNWHVVGASTVGLDHRRAFRPRDDAFVIRSAGDWIAVAIADGAGGYLYSRYGAAFCANAVCDHLLSGAVARSMESRRPTLWKRDSEMVAQALRRRPGFCELPNFVEVSGAAATSFTDESGVSCGSFRWFSPCIAEVSQAKADEEFSDRTEEVNGSGSLQELVINSLRDTRRDLERFVHERGIRMKDAMTTLMVLLVNTEAPQSVAAQIGDGLIAYRDESGSYSQFVRAVLPPEPGCIHSIVDEDWESYIALSDDALAAGPNEFLMLSDGVANDCPPLPAACLFEGWQTPERAAMAASVELLQWLSTYEHEDSDDDRTVAALWRTGAS